MTIYRLRNDLDWTNCVYVGRPNRQVPVVAPGRDGRFSNPFPVEGSGPEARCAAIEKFAAWVVSDSPDAARLRRSLGDLKDRDLVCWCAPKRCHAEVLLLLADGGTTEDMARFVSEIRADLIPPALFNI